MIKIGFVSLGCPKNLTDTETMIGLLENGCEIVTNPADADIIIVNTCGFIESAKQESIDTIIEMGAYKNGGALKKLIVTGCLAQRYADEILTQLPEVDAVVGTGSYTEIKRVVEETVNGRHGIYKGDINASAAENLPRRLSTPKYTAYLKIADGCDNKCTYCIIPQLRGKYRSRKMENIVAEAEKLAASGVRELILIAQDTSVYGTDIYGKPVLPVLLEKLSEIKGIRWIRVHYCYPETVTDELTAAFASLDKVCKYIDIPFQHASNNVLKRMGRKTTYEKNMSAAVRLRSAVPDIVIRSSFITGFPSETEEDFEILKKFIREARLDRVGVFPYSAEEGTPAAKLDGQLEEAVKIKRQEEIMRIQQEISTEICAEKIGRICEVLCEGAAGENLYVGRSYADSPEIDGRVIFKADRKIAEGAFVNVKITKAGAYDLEGDFIEYCE